MNKQSLANLLLDYFEVNHQQPNIKVVDLYKDAMWAVQFAVYRFAMSRTNKCKTRSANIAGVNRNTFSKWGKDHGIKLSN